MSLASAAATGRGGVTRRTAGLLIDDSNSQLRRLVAVFNGGGGVQGFSGCNSALQQQYCGRCHSGKAAENKTRSGKRGWCRRNAQDRFRDFFISPFVRSLVSLEKGVRRSSSSRLAFCLSLQNDTRKHHEGSKTAKTTRNLSDIFSHTVHEHGKKKRTL